MSGEVILILFIALGVMGLFVYLDIRKKKAYIEKIRNMSIDEKRLEVAKLQTQMGKYKTSHVLHFLLSFLFVGMWIVPWVLISVNNSSHRSKIEKMINEM